MKLIYLVVFIIIIIIGIYLYLFIQDRKNKGKENKETYLKTKELHDFFKETCGATCCRILTKGKERNSPERKEQCTKFVAATVKKTAEIILREL